MRHGEKGISRFVHYSCQRCSSAANLKDVVYRLFVALAS
ncbi:hypothetical protein AmDm5_2388 [Acetobacter malorum]|nr:hypothetical protein AmDm5_2388 [Acetobacter malorum]